MPISVTNPTNGTAMSWSTLATQFGTMRTWVNAVPSGDVTAGCVQREHLVRPVTQGWPTNGQTSGWRASRWGELDVDGLPLYGGKRWSLPNKVTIYPDGADRPGAAWTTPIGAACDRNRSNVRVKFSCSVRVRMDPLLFDGVTYTRHVKAGTLQIRGRNELYDLEVEAPSSAANVYCQNYADTGDNLGTLTHRIQTLALFTAPLDRVYVVFVRASDDVDQVDLTRISFQLEVW